MSPHYSELATQPFQEYRRPLSGEEILEEINELVRLEKPDFDTPRRIQMVLTSLETNTSLASIEGLKYYRMVQELIMKMLGDLALDYQKLAIAGSKKSLNKAEQLAWADRFFRPYEMISQALLEQYRAVALRLVAK